MTHLALASFGPASVHEEEALQAGACEPLSLG